MRTAEKFGNTLLDLSEHRLAKVGVGVAAWVVAMSVAVGASALGLSHRGALLLTMVVLVGAFAGGTWLWSFLEVNKMLGGAQGGVARFFAPFEAAALVLVLMFLFAIELLVFLGGLFSRRRRRMSLHPVQDDRPARGEARSASRPAD